MAESLSPSLLKSFDEVFRHGKGFGDGLIRVQYVDNSNKGLRWGVAVSAKRYKRAVDRNAVKRRVREAVRPLLLFIPPHYDIVFLFVGDEGVTYPVKGLRLHTQKLLHQHYLIKTPTL